MATSPNNNSIKLQNVTDVYMVGWGGGGVSGSYKKTLSQKPLEVHLDSLNLLRFQSSASKSMKPKLM